MDYERQARDIRYAWMVVTGQKLRPDNIWDALNGVHILMEIRTVIALSYTTPYLDKLAAHWPGPDGERIKAWASGTMLPELEKIENDIENKI